MALIYCSKCGAQISDKAPKCPSCGVENIALGFQNVNPQPSEPMRMGVQSPQIPYIANDEYPSGSWNWGAFMFTWIWGIFNGIYWPLFLLAAPFVFYISFTFGILVIPTASLIVAAVLGAKGNEMAWNAGKINWKDSSRFNFVQEMWNKAGIAAAISFLAFILMFIFSISIITDKMAEIALYFKTLSMFNS